MEERVTLAHHMQAALGVARHVLRDYTSAQLLVNALWHPWGVLQFAHANLRVLVPGVCREI